MRMIVLMLALIILGELLYSQATVTIGTGTATQKQPFGMWASYERSASLYLSSEIGSLGSYGMMINSLAWNVGTGDPTTCPSKIYLKSTTATNLTATSWASITNNATLVYDAAGNFPTLGWHLIDIADFAYTSGNLLVLCETNYGGSGATFYPIFKYSYFPGKHQFWQEYDLPPTGSGSVNENRPNIQINYTLITSSVVPPSGFMAVPVSSSEVNLQWKKNAAGDGVLVAYSLSNTFGTPTGSYVAGDAIAGGGTVIYNGSGTSFSQTSGLDPGITYYYKAWSVHPPGPGYSIGTGALAITLCDAVSMFPNLTDFESAAFPPACWSQSGIPWLRSNQASSFGNGTASAFADFFNTSSGDFELISPVLDFGTLASPVISFGHAYATYSGQVDRLELWYSTDQGSTYILLTTWLGGLNGPLNTGGATSISFVPTQAQWASKSWLLPVGTNKVKFRGVSGYGNNLFIDNISFSGECPSPSDLSATNLTSLSADLSWVSAGQATQWQISWGAAGFNPDTEGTIISGITTYPFLLENLVQGTSYEFYVRSDCGGALSSWSGPAGFTTLCSLADVPYFENFDNLIVPETGCYVVSDENNDGHQWMSSATFPESFPNSMVIIKNQELTMDDWFFTPGINLAEGVTYALNFNYSREGSGSPDKLEVKWGTSQSVTGMSEGSVWYNGDIQSVVYVSGSTTLTPASTGVYYLGWHGHSLAAQGAVFVDNIRIDVAHLEWNGTFSDDWEEPANWTPSCVPNEFQDATIPAGTLNYPVIYYSGATCKNLSIGAGALLTIESDTEVTIRGSILIQENGVLNNQGILHLLGNLDNQNN